MLYITMLRCRQREKDASLKYYKNRLVQLKNIQKSLKAQLAFQKNDLSIKQVLNELTIELSKVKSKIENIEAEIQNNNNLINIEEKNLAREAAMAKERVMAARAAKAKLNNQTA